MLFSITYSLKGLKKKLEKDEDNDIKYLINDYYNYYNCKKKYPIILIIQIIYLIIELINMIFILKKSSYTSLPTHIPGISSIQILEFQKEGKNADLNNRNQGNENNQSNDNKEKNQNNEQSENTKLNAKENKEQNKNNENENNEQIKNKGQNESNKNENHLQTQNEEQNENNEQTQNEEQNENNENENNAQTQNEEQNENNEQIENNTNIEVNEILQIRPETNSIQENVSEQSYLKTNPIIKQKEKKIIIKYEVILFPNKFIEMEANPNERFSVELEKLINKFDFFVDNSIKNIFTDEKMIYSEQLNEVNQYRTLNDFDIKDNTIIHIVLEENDINKIIDKNKIFIDNQQKKEEKEQMPNNIIPFTPCLNFVNTISSDNIIYKIKVDLEEKLIDAYNRLISENLILKNYKFEEIRFGGKKYNFQDSQSIIFKTIKELNLNIYEYIYLDGKILEDNLIELHFYWKNNPSNEYIIEIGRKETFYNAFLKLLSIKDLECYFITCCYRLINKKCKGEDLKEQINNSINYDSQESDGIEFKKIKFKSFSDISDTNNYFEKDIIQEGTFYNNSTLESLDIDEETKIYFETEKNIPKIEEITRKEEEQKYDDYLKKNNLGDKQLIYFHTTDCNKYVLFIDKKVKIFEVIELLKKTYISFNDLKLGILLCEGKKLENEKTIEESDIKSPVLINVD